MVTITEEEAETAQKISDAEARRKTYEKTAERYSVMGDRAIAEMGHGEDFDSEGFEVARLHYATATYYQDRANRETQLITRWRFGRWA